MVRGVWYLGGFLVLIVLAGCARLAWFGEREPWRGEAEVACLRSGAVRESPAVTILKPIQGPGMCGADFPLKVSALGDIPITGYADDVVRPPGVIPANSPLYTGSSERSTSQSPAYEPDPLYAPAPDPYPGSGLGSVTSPAASGAPLSLTPPGLEPAYDAGPPPGLRFDQRTGGYPPTRDAAPAPYPPGLPTPTVPLGPSRGPPVTASIEPVSVNPPATLACPIVSALDRWIADSVQPAALRWLGQPVVEIKQISSYSCRGMNGDSTAHISEHAFGNALDIAAFTFADGRKMTVQGGWHGLPEEQGFLRDIQEAACQQFATVLAPGANVYHYDHIHVDLMRRESGRRICEPEPIPGEVAAARARYAMRRSGDPSITGTIKSHPSAQPPTRFSPHQRDAEDENRPRALPGED
jgi:Extensin-like protein C-terminus